MIYIRRCFGPCEVATHRQPSLSSCWAASPGTACRGCLGGAMPHSQVPLQASPPDRKTCHSKLCCDSAAVDLTHPLISYTDSGTHDGPGREVPPPLLVAHKQTQAGAYLRHAGGLPAGAGGRAPGLVVRYAACGGLFNQHYCHVTAIAMAIALGAEGVVSSSCTAQLHHTAVSTYHSYTRCARGMPGQPGRDLCNGPSVGADRGKPRLLCQVMPPALRRNKFATDARNASWHPAPASSVWDLRRLRAYAASEPRTPVPPAGPETHVHTLRCS
jgi:hypothetical protein